MQKSLLSKARISQYSGQTQPKAKSCYAVLDVVERRFATEHSTLATATPNLPPHPHLYPHPRPPFVRRHPRPYGHSAPRTVERGVAGVHRAGRHEQGAVDPVCDNAEGVNS